MTAPQDPTAPSRAGAYGLGLGALFFLSGALGLSTRSSGFAGCT